MPEDTPGWRPARTATWLSQTANRIAATVKSPAVCLVIASEMWFPGWRAYVNGEQVRIIRANHSFRALEVPPGEHHVEMVFVPMPFFAGLGLTTLTALTLAVLAARDSRRRANP